MPEKFDLKDYVTVPERVAKFYEKHPEGRIQTTKPEVFELGGQIFLWCQATVWRAPDDPIPVVAGAWQDYPGRTPYTKWSEAMNAETSAIGRALWALGIEARKGAWDGGQGNQPTNRVPDDHQAPPPPPEDWRGKFLLACQEAKVLPAEVCMRASDGARDDIMDFADVERFALGQALRSLSIQS